MGGSGRGEDAVAVAVPVVNVVKVAAHPVVDVVGVADRFVTAIGAVRVGRRVAAARVVGRAARRIHAGCIDPALVHVSLVGLVEVSVVEIVDVTGVEDRRMAAAGGMGVGVVGVGFVVRHFPARLSFEAPGEGV